MDPIWKREMQRWVTVVVDQIKHQLASRGGPILWLQIENEYDPDDEYLDWAADMARNITEEVPWTLCGHNITQCNHLNRRASQSKDLRSGTHENKVACTINGFWMEKGEDGSQPGPEFFQKLWDDNPTQPAVWTEDQGWFDIWGMAKRVRWTSDQLYGIARFFAYGGSYHNFYMLTGGNNYGLRAGRDATTAYAPDTVIDNLLLRHEPHFSIYKDFFTIMKSAEDELLKHPVPRSSIPLNRTRSTLEQSQEPSTAEAHEYGYLVFLSNIGEVKSDSSYFDYKGDAYLLNNHTVVLLNASSSTVLFNSSTAMQSLQPEPESRLILRISDWVHFKEVVGYGAIVHAPMESPEQLNITDNHSDYLWYTFYTSDTGKISVQDNGWGGLHYSYVNGILSDRTGDLKMTRENRKRSRVLGLQEGSQTEPLQSPKKIDIFSVAMGLSTVVSPQTGKGIKSVTIGESGLPQTSLTTSWKLKGEELAIYTDDGTKRVEWHPFAAETISTSDGLLWIKGSFDLPSNLASFSGGAQPNQTALVLNLSGLHKGVAYVNGFHIGRYWLIAGQCNGDCAPPRHGEHCYLHYKDCGEPTQHLYHIPFEALRPTNNMVVLFEETAPATGMVRNLTQVHLEVLHDHPI
jgi:hypothetical protein